MLILSFSSLFQVTNFPNDECAASNGLNGTCLSGVSSISKISHLLCPVPYCTVLYCTVIYCTVPYRTVRYSTLPVGVFRAGWSLLWILCPGLRNVLCTELLHLRRNCGEEPDLHQVPGLPLALHLSRHLLLDCQQC